MFCSWDLFASKHTTSAVFTINESNINPTTEQFTESSHSVLVLATGHVGSPVSRSTGVFSCGLLCKQPVIHHIGALNNQHCTLIRHLAAWHHFIQQNPKRPDVWFYRESLVNGSFRRRPSHWDLCVSTGCVHTVLKERQRSLGAHLKLHEPMIHNQTCFDLNRNIDNYCSCMSPRSWMKLQLELTSTTTVRLNY